MGNRYVRMKRLIVAALLWAGFANAQDGPGYHQLRAEEFEGMPEFNRADVVAYTHCYIDFNYHAKSERGIYRLTAEVKLQFNRDKSWINKRKVFSTKMMDDILDHEQGHYTIAYMEQQELIRDISRTRFDANYQKEAEALFDRVHEKYRQLSADYDDDTAHMTNRNQQRSWDKYFQKRLAFMPPAEIASN